MSALLLDAVDALRPGVEAARSSTLAAAESVPKTTLSGPMCTTCEKPPGPLMSAFVSRASAPLLSRRREDCSFCGGSTENSSETTDDRWLPLPRLLRDPDARSSGAAAT